MIEEKRKALDALDVLMQHHREVESLFSEFEYLHKNGRDTTRVMEAACGEIKIHDAIENDIFYPAVSDAAGEEGIDALLDDAEDSHDAALDLIEELEEAGADAAKRHPHFMLLIAQVKQHIMDEETELFPRVRKLEQLDLASLGSQMKARETELVAEAELAEAGEKSAQA
jgi:hemerythrin-like domain-containing protein